MKYLIKYSPEMTTKSRIVRTRFCRQLRKNIARLLRERLGLVDRAAAPNDPDAIGVEALWDNLQVDLPDKHSSRQAEIEEILGNTPGIWSFLRVLEYPLGDMDDILARTKQVYAERLRGKRFVVRCKRAGRHAFNSMDVERFVGGGLLHQCETGGVDLHHPDLVVALEIRNDELFIVDQALDGLGGFPLGTQDSVLSLISGGFDSAVSTYLALKRGLRAHFLFFNLGGSEHELAVKELSYYLWLRFGASHHVLFITVPFEDVVAQILEKVENSQMGVVLKRMMLRAACRVAESLQVDALVTGESVAQVSSQTLTNLAVIDEASERLVLRPLIATDKEDIVNMATEIGTRDFAASMPEYCGVISVNPTTRARRHRIAREEERFDFGVLERAIENRVQHDIQTLAEQQAPQAAPVPVTAMPDNAAVVIDIRHPDEEEKRPLALADEHKVLHIPFYRLNSKLGELDRDTTYLLYCGKGVMSRLHAAHLREQGWPNIGVYQP